MTIIEENQMERKTLQQLKEGVRIIRDKHIKIQNDQFLHIYCGKHDLTLQWDEGLNRWFMVDSTQLYRVISIGEGFIFINDKKIE